MNQCARDSWDWKHGMSRVQAESFPAVAMLRRNRQQEETSFAELMSCARTVLSQDRDHCFAGRRNVRSHARARRLRLRAAAGQCAADRHSVAAGRDAPPDTRPAWRLRSNAYAAVLAARGMQGVTAIASGM